MLSGEKYSKIDQVKFFKGCLSQNLLGPFLDPNFTCSTLCPISGRGCIVSHFHRFIYCKHLTKLKHHVSKTLLIFVCFKINEIYIVIPCKKEILLAVALSVTIFLKKFLWRFRCSWGSLYVILKILCLTIQYPNKLGLYIIKICD